ncbi:MAG: hypothetical protein E7293_10890 [Lachnospiraceae bacterium]|nr:hypothetical protein [Lachnospiraceae bacterium]
MTWKKTWFSYFCWACYLLVTGILAMSLLKNEMQQLGMQGMLAGPVAVLLSFLAGGIVFTVVLVILKHKKKTILPKNVWPAIEGLLFAGLLATGLLLRLYQFPQQMPENIYFDLAKVTADMEPVNIAHGAGRLYVLLLQTLFRLVGNQWMAGVALQMVLQFASAILIYCGVRKISSALPALWTLGFMMLMPSSIEAGFGYHPIFFYLFLYSLGFCLLAGALKSYARGGMRKWPAYIGIILLGFYIGFLTYLDVMGATLLILCVGLFGLIFPKQEGEVKNGDVLTVGLVAGTLAGLFGCFGLEGFIGGNGVLSVINTWEWYFMPRAWDMGVYVALKEMLQSHVAAEIILSIGLVVGVFVFWLRRDKEYQWIWSLMILVAVVFSYSCKAQVYLERGFLLYLWLIVGAGCGIRELFQSKAEEAAEGAYEAQEDTPPVEEPEDQPLTEEKRTVKLIENPLPLPKRHVKKKMGYRIEVPEEQMCYDIEVDPEDDFER